MHHSLLWFSLPQKKPPDKERTLYPAASLPVFDYSTVVKSGISKRYAKSWVREKLELSL